MNLWSYDIQKDDFFRKTTLQEERKQENDLDMKNQDDPKWLVEAFILVHLG